MLGTRGNRLDGLGDAAGRLVVGLRGFGHDGHGGFHGPDVGHDAAGGGLNGGFRGLHVGYAENGSHSFQK